MSVPTEPRAVSRSSIQRPSRALLAAFSGYLHWYMARAFHAVRVARPERFPVLAAGSPTIVCLNHPSWWDPLVAILLSRHFARQADHYAPMDASALRRYGFMRQLGLFPLDTNSSHAGAQFLRSAGDVLARPDTLLWITPEGHFTDIRKRPTEWRPGLAALVARQTRCTVLPIAIEYTFWDERLPEALTLIGEPLHISNGRSQRSDAWQTILTEAMTHTQQELAALGIARNPAPFTTLLRGGSGIAPIYNGWKRLQAHLRRHPYTPEHGSLPPA